MSTLDRLRALHYSEQIEKAVAGFEQDPFAPHEQELQLRAGLYDAWSLQLQKALHDIKKFQEQHTFTVPNKEEVNQLIGILSKYMGGEAFTRLISTTAEQTVEDTFNRGKQHVNAMFRKQTGRDVQQKDLSGIGFGVIFGLTEDHAMHAVTNQLTVSAGGFWEDQLSDSLKDGLEEFFDGELSRAELAGKIETLVNNKLSIERALPRSYFDGLSEHLITRARNIGSFYRAQNLDVKHYRLRNPNDRRTSPICAQLTKGQLFTMKGAGSIIQTILTATSLGDLKGKVPFLTPDTAASADNPVPPLHWLCRTWMEYVFEQLEALAGL